MGSAPALSATNSAEAEVAAVDAGLADADQWARQRAVLLAFSRRTAALSKAETLIHDAASLVAETLQAPVFCSAHLPGDATTLSLRLTCAGAATVEATLPRSATSACESLAGYAIEARRPVICENLATETRCKDAFLRNQGVVSGLMMPLCMGESSFGALGVFYPAQHRLNPSDVEFAETIGHMLAGTLARLQAEEGWRVERRLAASLFQDVDSLVIITDRQGRVQRINRACEQASGYTGNEVRGRLVWSVFAPPAHVEPAHARLREGVARGTNATFHLPMLTKHAAERPVRWTQTVLVDEDGRAQSVLVSGAVAPETPTGTANEADEANPAFERHESVDRAAAATTFDAGTAAATPFQVTPGPGNGIVRESTRRAYPYRQLVAAHQAGVPPERLAFQEAQFHDISAGGVSFRMPSRPTFDTVVLALGVPPNLHYISAQVVNVAEFEDDGCIAFHVGCKFIERLRS